MTTTASDGLHGAALAVLVAAVVAAAAWLTWALLLWFRRVPRLPRVGKETATLGPEPPAVANLLVNGWYVTSEAIPATLLDLAARRVVRVEEVGPDRFVVRVRDGDRSGLAPAELQVVRLVEARATGGSAPVDVLRLAPADGASWLGRFSAAVVADAEARGLATKGFPRRQQVALAVGLAAVLGLVALASELAHVTGTPAHRSGQRTTGAWFVVAFVVWIATVSVMTRVHSLRATPSGRDACARWLGVRAHLRRDEHFVAQPPAAVVIWGRTLAYGVALGANRAAVAALPLGPDDRRHVWSRASGTWRQLRVREPKRFGAGEAPRRVLVGGVLRLLAWCTIGALVLRVVVDVLSALPDAAGPGDLVVLALALVFVAVPTIAMIYIGAHIVDGAVRTWRGVMDLHRITAVVGSVATTFDGRFVVDDGDDEDVIAFRMPDSTPVTVGDHVRVTFTPGLHHVERVDVLEREEPQHGAVQAMPPDVDIEH